VPACGLCALLATLFTLDPGQRDAVLVVRTLSAGLSPIQLLLMPCALHLAAQADHLDTRYRSLAQSEDDGIDKTPSSDESFATIASKLYILAYLLLAGWGVLQLANGVIELINATFAK
jgi:hypothetical protein